jgi:hypothetical protein
MIGSPTIVSAFAGKNMSEIQSAKSSEYVFEWIASLELV